MNFSSCQVSEASKYFEFFGQTSPNQKLLIETFPEGEASGKGKEVSTCAKRYPKNKKKSFLQFSPLSRIRRKKHNINSLSERPPKVKSC